MKKAFLLDMDVMHLRSGIPAEIIGVVFATPDGRGRSEQACYRVKFEDGVEDVYPINALQLQVTTEEDTQMWKMKKAR